LRADYRENAQIVSLINKYIFSDLRVFWVKIMIIQTIFNKRTI